MFPASGPKRATVIRTKGVINPVILEQQLQKLEHKECNAKSVESWGFCPPDESKNWPILPVSHNHAVITLRRDVRKINKTRLSRKWRELIREKEKELDRKLEKPERDELKDKAEELLTPLTPPTEHTTRAVYFMEFDTIVVFEKSVKLVEYFIEKLNVALKAQNASITFDAKSRDDIGRVLTLWTTNEEVIPKELEITLGKKIRLQENDITAELKNQELDSAEVREHLHSGKLVEEVEIVWKEKVSALLTRYRTLGQINFKEFCKSSIADSHKAEEVDVRGIEEATFLIHMSAFWEMWSVIKKIQEDDNAHSDT